jgi:hypothetical protein
MPYKISGTKSEISRIIILNESDWSIESNTVVSGSGAYEIDSLETGNKSVIARANDGEIIGYGGVASEYYAPAESWVAYFDSTKWEAEFENGTWDTDHWEPNVGSGGLSIRPINGWEVDFRPSKIRVTYTGTLIAALKLWAGSTDQYYLMEQLPYTSLDEVIIDFETYDFDITRLSAGISSGYYEITNIEFLV